MSGAIKLLSLILKILIWGEKLLFFPKFVSYKNGILCAIEATLKHTVRKWHQMWRELTDKNHRTKKSIQVLYIQHKI